MHYLQVFLTFLTLVIFTNYGTDARTTRGCMELAGKGDYVDTLQLANCLEKIENNLLVLSKGLDTLEKEAEQDFPNFYRAASVFGTF